MTKRNMPHNLDAEQGVLGCVMIDNDACVGGFARLLDTDFYSTAHKAIFNAMRKVFERNTPIDLVTTVEQLQSENKLEAIGGLQYLTAVADAVPSAANFRHYVDILRKNRMRRRLIEAGNSIVQVGYEGEDEQASLQIAEKAVFDIARDEEKKELTIIGAELPAVLEKLDTIQKDPTSMRGMRTGFYGLDDLTNGLQKSELIILAARPSVGKTALGLNIALNAAIKRKQKCAIFSLEMSKQSLTMRALCSLACVSLHRALKGELDAEEWKRVWLANKELSAASVYIDDNSVITPAEITRKCMRLKREQGLDFVMIDYLGLMGSGSMKRENRQVEVSDNSRFIKIMAKELDVPVLLLSQLNRAIEKRTGEDSRPQLSDLRESGAIEQDADIVMFIHRDKGDEGENEDAELIIRKNRNGPLGTIKLKWKGDWATFMNLSADQAAEIAKDKASKKK
jgi:replicative DNA helicase